MQNYAFQSLPKAFYLRPTAQVARDLLGKILLHEATDGLIAARISETEAYLGHGDAASHSFRGRTKRNAPMFEEGGICYVYLCYGIHHCMNAVTGLAGLGEAVLLRAAVPLTIERTCAILGVDPSHLTTRQRDQILGGPGKLCKGLGVNMSHSGTDLIGGKLRLVDDGFATINSTIEVTSRIGISKDVDLPPSLRSTQQSTDTTGSQNTLLK